MLTRCRALPRLRTEIAEAVEEIQRRRNPDEDL
jgi:hypothetical protein